MKQKIFEAPIQLKIGDKPLNSIAGEQYPAPNIYDVDGDGDPEMVIGSLSGFFHVYENTNKKKNEAPIWAKPRKLETASGKAISVPNW